MQMNLICTPITNRFDGIAALLNVPNMNNNPLHLEIRCGLPGQHLLSLWSEVV